MVIKMLYDYEEGDNCPICGKGILTEFQVDGEYGEYVIKCQMCGYYEEYDVFDCFTGNSGYNKHLKPSTSFGGC